MEIPPNETEGLVAKSLRLWKVMYSINNFFMGYIGLTFCKVDDTLRTSFNDDAARAIAFQDDQELAGGDNISSIWENVSDSHLHVAVRLPGSSLVNQR